MTLKNFLTRHEKAIEKAVKFTAEVFFAVCVLTVIFLATPIMIGFLGLMLVSISVIFAVSLCAFLVLEDSE